MPALKKVAEFVLRQEGRADAELSVTLVDKETMRSLNKKYRRQDRATDVLSFNLSDALPDRLLGEVVIAPEVAAAQARRRGGDLMDELTILLTHGLLHLLGYKHGREDGPAMRNRRRELITALERSTDGVDEA